mgnify:FL=1
MGFMASFGSAARVLGAVAAGWAYQNDRMILCLILLIVFVATPSIALWIWHLLYKRRQSHEEIKSELIQLVDVEKATSVVLK